jgi:hypothetical protein
LRQRTVPPCRSHYPGGPPRVRLSVLPRGVAAFLPLERSRRPRLPFRGLLGIHSRCGPDVCWAHPPEPVVPEASTDGIAPTRLPGSYRGVPTLPRVELSSTGFSAPFVAHSNDLAAHPREPTASVGRSRELCGSRAHPVQFPARTRGLSRSSHSQPHAVVACRPACSTTNHPPCTRRKRVRAQRAIVRQEQGHPAA